MPVKEVTQTPEERQQEQQELKEKRDSLENKLFSSLDLSEEEEHDEVQGGRLNKDKPKEESKEESEEQEEESEESSEEQEDTEEESDEEDEELIPKSKFLKRIEREKLAKAKLEAELEELKANKKSNVSDRRSKLESMNEKELKALKRDVRKKQLDAKDDSDTLDQLLDLEDEIDDVIRTGPSRFQQSQVKEFNKSAQKIIDDNPDIDFNKYANDIKEAAIKIYQKEKDLQKIKRGQAIALELAFEHFKEVSKYKKVKSKEVNKQQQTKLKRKTSLDSGSVKGDASNSSRRKLYEKAKNSHDYDDKLAFFDEIITPDVDKLLK